jgi:hypothetical protein
MMSTIGRGVVLVYVVAALTGGAARAQDLDQNKSATKLFANNCATCHHSARGLTKGRFSWSLSNYLQQHYTSSPASAQALAGYLLSVDAPPARPAKSAARPAKPHPAAASARSRPQAIPAAASEAVPRPPASVPRR